jgi:hypothetical protein
MNELCTSSLAAPNHIGILNSSNQGMFSCLWHYALRQPSAALSIHIPPQIMKCSNCHSYARNDRPGLRSTHLVIFIQGVGVKTGPNNLPHYYDSLNDCRALFVPLLSGALPNLAYRFAHSCKICYLILVTWSESSGVAQGVGRNGNKELAGEPSLLQVQVAPIKP